MLKTEGGLPTLYEERITLWRADGFDDAIRLAEEDARDYATNLGAGCAYLGLAQAYLLPDPPGHGAELFSLIRGSDLAPESYLNTFFDTGAELPGVPDDEN